MCPDKSYRTKRAHLAFMQAFEPEETEKFYGKKIVPSFFGDEEFNEWM